MDTHTVPRLHSIATVGERTALSKATLYREIKAGRLSACKIGKSVRISEEELQNFIALHLKSDK